jgi:succinoglycan biosynthesis transport protein ExoP
VGQLPWAADGPDARNSPSQLVNLPVLPDESQSRTYDVARILRAHWWLILLVTILSGAIAFAVSKREKPLYSAQAALAVTDPGQGSALIVASSSVTQTPAELAAAYVPQVERGSVIQAVRTALGGQLTADEIKAAISTSVDPSSNLVLIAATAGTGARAAAIANGVALQDARQSTQAARRTYDAEATRLQARIQSLNQTDRAAYVEQLSALQSLGALAQPVAVISTAPVPASPVAPKPVRNAIIGVIIGLLLGIALAFARERHDHRLRDPQEIGDGLGLSILGSIPKAGFGGVTSGNGNGRAAGQILESFQILRQNVEFLHGEDRRRCIAVTSAMPGEGKSTVSAGLALASARLGRRTLLMECDLRRPVLAHRLGLQRGPGLTDYLVGAITRDAAVQVVDPQIQVEDAVVGTVDAADGTELHCITAGAIPPNPATHLSSPRFLALLREVAELYEFVVLDTSPLLPVVDTLGLVPYASAVLICARSDQTTRDQARAARAALDRLPSPPAGAVVTAVPQSAGYSYAGYAYTG